MPSGESTSMFNQLEKKRKKKHVKQTISLSSAKLWAKGSAMTYVVAPERILPLGGAIDRRAEFGELRCASLGYDSRDRTTNRSLRYHLLSSFWMPTPQKECLKPSNLETK